MSHSYWTIESPSPSSGSQEPLPSSIRSSPTSIEYGPFGSATGGSFTAPTITRTEALSLPPRPSVTVYVKVSVPLKPASGV